MSTKQIEKIVENVPYENLKVKLVDIFEFKLKNAFEYVDFIEVIKPEWASNVTYSKIFLELYKFKVNKEKDKDNEKKIEKENNNNIDNQDIKDEENIIREKISIIPKCNETRTFTEEKGLLDILGNKDVKDKKENNKNVWPKNKNKKGKRLNATEIKGGFIYD